MFPGGLLGGENPDRRSCPPDPVGVRVRSPSQKTPKTIPDLHKGRSTKDAKLPRTVAFGIPKPLNVLAACEIEDALWILSNLAKARCRTTSWWFIRLDRRCNMLNTTIWTYGSAGLVCPEKSGQDRTHERQWSAIIVPLRCFHQRSSWWENGLDSCGGRRCRHSHHD